MECDCSLEYNVDDKPLNNSRSEVGGYKSILECVSALAGVEPDEGVYALYSDLVSMFKPRVMYPVLWSCIIGIV